MKIEVIAVIIGVLLTSTVSTIGFLIRSLLNNIYKELLELKGSFEPIRKDLKENTVEMIQLKSELKAIWRYIDAPKRNTDRSA